MKIIRALFIALSNWTILKPQVSVVEKGDYRLSSVFMPVCGYFVTFFSYLPFVILSQYCFLSSTVAALIAVIMAVIFSGGSGYKCVYRFANSSGGNGKMHKWPGILAVVAILVGKFIAVKIMAQQIFPWYAATGPVVARFMVTFLLSSYDPIEHPQHNEEEMVGRQNPLIQLGAFFFAMPCLLLPGSPFLFGAIVLTLLLVKALGLKGQRTHKMAMGVLIDTAELTYLAIAAYIAGDALFLKF